MESLIQYNDYIDRLFTELELRGVKVEKIHKEIAYGQFEIVLGHSDPLTATDHYLRAREALGGKNRYYCTDQIHCILPKVDLNDLGNGCHVHISLWRDGVNITGDRFKLSEEAEFFLGGIH